VIVLLVGLVVLFALRRPIMGSIGCWLVVTEDPAPSDVIVVLGGESGHRILKAIELYKNGYAPRIAITGPAAEFEEFEPAPYKRWLDLLERRGVPRDSIDFVAPSFSTYDDAMLCREYFEENGFRSALVVTDPYHTRRADWVFDRMNADREWDLRTIACDQQWFAPRYWWRDERQFLWVMTEYMKLSYYVFSYGLSGPLDDRPSRAHRRARETARGG